MASYSFAHRLSTHSFAAGDLTQTVAAGQTVYIYGLHIFNNSGGALTYTVKNAAGTTLFVVDVATLGHEAIECPFLADGGLTITASGAGGYGVVMHTNPGL